MDSQNKIRLALSLTEPGIKSQCPSDEKLSELIDNRMDPDEKNNLFEHLNACPKCYQQWIELSSDQKENSISGKSEKRGFKTTGIAAAAAACMIFMIWTSLLRQPEMSDLIDRSYHTAFNHEFSLKNLEKESIPEVSGESEIKRSLSHQPRSSAAIAFTAGFKSGRQELKTGLQNHDAVPSEWKDSEWVPCFFLGRWCVLLQTVCRSEKEIPLSFWKQQRDILDRMDNLFSRQYQSENMFEIEIVKKALQQLKAHLESELSKKYDPKSTCRLLEPELEAIKASLS